jgi:hypothetical protein
VVRSRRQQLQFPLALPVAAGEALGDLDYASCVLTNNHNIGTVSEAMCFLAAQIKMPPIFRKKSFRSVMTLGDKPNIAVIDWFGSKLCVSGILECQFLLVVTHSLFCYSVHEWPSPDTLRSITDCGRIARNHGVLVRTCMGSEVGVRLVETMDSN